MNRKNRRMAAAAMVMGSVFQLGFLESCDDTLVSLTRQFEPCGTIFANCNPGDFEVNRAPIGDFCVDPACTVPGQCGGGQPIGTITDICP